MPGRIAADTMKPRKSSAITILIFQRASAATTIEPETSVTTAARRAVALMSRVPALPVEAFNPDAYRIRRARVPRRAPSRRHPRTAVDPCTGARRAGRDGFGARLARFGRGPRAADRRGLGR